jgi:hypothetical protein
MNMSTFSTSQFHFDPKFKLLTQEISMLSEGSKKPVFKQIYADAGDEGITIVSAETGASIDFVVYSVDDTGTGTDREIAWWRLKPTAESLRKLPFALRKRSDALRVLIIND